MTVVDDALDDGSPARERWTPQVPDVLRRATWRFYLFAPVLVVAIVAAPLLAMKGFSILRTEDTGQVISDETDPNAGGFQALVTPTPTSLLVDVAPDGTLAGVTLITLPSQEGGGNIVLFPVGTVLDVPLRVPPEATLVDIYAEGGLSALEQRIETMLGAGITEAVEVPRAQWAELVQPVAPLTVQNPVAAQTTNAAGQPVSFPAGEIQLTAAQVGLYLQADTPEQADTVRLTRHEAFWTSWMSALDEAGESAVPGEGEIGVGGAVRGLVGGPRNITTLPATPVPIPGVPLSESDLFRPNGLAIVATVPDLIPFPVGVGRLRTRLVMGVEDQTALLPDAAHTLVQAGSRDQRDRQRRRVRRDRDRRLLLPAEPTGEGPAAAQLTGHGHPGQGHRAQRQRGRGRGPRPGLHRPSGRQQPVDHGPRRRLGAHHRADRWRGQRGDPRWSHARRAGG